ncbi:hypothetical protein Tco_0525482 [Tanacetum coccineum]
MGYRGRVRWEMGMGKLGKCTREVVWPRNCGRGWYGFGAKGLSSGSGLTADSSVLTLTLAFLDFGLDFAQSFPFHAQFCHFGLDHDISLLNSRAACLASTLDDAKVACAKVGDKITSLTSERDMIASEGHALGQAINFGMQEGLEAGYEHGVAGRNLSVVDAYNPEVAKASYINAVKALENIDFPLVNLLKSKKDARMDEVLDCFLLDGPLVGLPKAAYLQSCIEQFSIPIHHAGDNTTVGETSLSFALMNVHARAEGAKKHAAALRQLMMEIVSAPLSSQTWVGEASTSVAPLSIEDYDEEDTDEALGSVVAIPKLETCRF